MKGKRFGLSIALMLGMALPLAAGIERVDLQVQGMT